MRINIKKTAFLLVTALAVGFVACKKEKVELPTVKIFDSTISTTYTTANVTGEVTNEGGASVTSRGFFYSKQGGKADTVYSGGGKGVFSSEITGLEPNSTYTCGAFARNAGGTAYSGKVTFSTRGYAIATVKTNEVTGVTTTTATANGEVTADGGDAVTERGICYGTSQNPTVSGTHTASGEGTGSFAVNLTGLTANTTYYVRAYAKNSQGTAYGQEVSFTTEDYTTPVLTTSNVTNITQTSAKCGGNVTSDGGVQVTQRGVCWATTPNPTTSSNHAEAGEGTGEFFCDMTNLTANTTYYVRAYASNSKGTAYGDQLSFSTSTNPPTVSTGSVTSVTTTSAMGSGNVTSDGGNAVTERGLCWGSTNTPTIAGPHAAAGSGLGQFTAAITGLTANTTYYVRAYAINGTDTAYGEAVSFTTLSISVPGVTTATATNISYTTATCGGNVVSDGGATVTERGICWATTQNPTMSNTHQSSGTGTGEFSVNMTGLTANTTYHVRAYAVNSQGTAYGNDITLQTPDYSKPTVVTNNVTDISYTTATCGGNVTADGGATVTARGVCWSTSQNPTISGSHTTNGTGTGSFTSSITGLNSNTTYYVRAYATNSKGTNYGEQKQFKTLELAPPPTGAINGIFSVSETTQVYFSQGNLQYRASANIWRFAESQLDYIGSNNANISPSYSGWIDLFGWGTGNNPTNTSTCNSSFTDWGTNPISNGGNMANKWRTLTIDEWSFLMFNRTTTSGIRYAKATVNGVKGVIILPDDWSTSYYTLNSTNTTDAAFSANIITSANWTSKLEAYGAVFLPAAGIRTYSSVDYVGTYSYYNSSSLKGLQVAYYLFFDFSDLCVKTLYTNYGNPVRLVADAE